ncbi:MAG: flagellar hook-basal body complex protein [Clostridia bacterium]|nr:flagellar hook-basal body complex protein [Clostridia bacterium]
MMRSLYSGVSGLKTHQTRMDVIGNNIANVNTVAYKSSSMTFSDLMYQTTQSASGANAATGRGGVNAKQIGLGVVGGAINTSIATSGSTQTTGNPFDLRITGDSFFVVSNGNENYFTRAGAFYVDGMGNLAMTTNGYTVMGWQEDKTEPGTIKKDTVSALKIMSAENMTSSPEATTQAYISGIVDKNSTGVASDDGQIVALSFYDNLGYSYTAKYAIYDYVYDGTDKVDLPDGTYRMELTDVLTDVRNPQTGKLEPKSLTEIYGVDLDQIVTVNEATSAAGSENLYIRYNTSDGAYSGYSLNYDPLTDPTGGTWINSDPNTDNRITMDFNEATYDNFADKIEISMRTSTRVDNKGASTVKATSGDYDGQYAGRRIGKMSGVAIQTDGKIYASYDNGTKKLLGQIAVASFANPSGLEKAGENLYRTTQNSGAFDGIGEDVTAESGSISSGVLEMSNVDLSSEFTEMITTQRGFQANSRIITVSDTMIEELVNLKR